MNPCNQIHKAFLFVPLFLLSFYVHSQDIRVVASAPGVVENGQQFRLTFSLNAKASSFKAPAFDNFSFLGGPTTSQSTNISMVNGKVSQNFEITYTYFLQASKVGVFSLPPAQAVIDGKTYSSNALSIEVIKSTGKNNGSQASEKQPVVSGENEVSSDDLYLAILVDKKTVYLGEAVTATVKIYNRLNLNDLDSPIPPPFTSFYKNDIEVPPLRSLQPENVNGKVYQTGILQRFVLYPQKTGELTIDPYQLNCYLLVNNRSGSVWDDFFNQGFQQQVKRLIRSKPVKISVKPLPASGPANFSGAVGNFNMKVAADKTELNENDALTVKINVAGTGNVKLLESPKIDFPADFESYDPKVTSEVAPAGTSGTKTFEYLVIPRHAGEYRIPPVSFSYFDPASASYKQQSSGEFTIKVNKNAGSDQVNEVSGSSGEDVKFIGNDIRYIKTHPVTFRPAARFLPGSIFFYLYFLVLLLAFGTLVVFRRKQIKERADIAKLKDKRANKVARKRLKTAAILLKENKRELFFEELLKALYGYLGDKLHIPMAELSLDKAVEHLNFSGDPEFLSELKQLVDDCQFARYAPATETGALKPFYDRAVELIGKLEQKLK